MLVFVSQPFASLPSQLPKPGLHAPSWQVPFEQTALAFANEHDRPHIPQCESEVFVSASQPFDALPSQFPKPMAQVPSWQLPPEQLAPAFANEHDRPHIPQCESEVFVSASQPFAALPSQLA